MLARLRMTALILAVVGIHIPAFAQWTQQTIHLIPGWNAVFLEVDPQPRDCDIVFSGIPVESVWAWNRRFKSVQFVQDPRTLLPDQPEWLTFHPSSSPNAFLTNLFIVQGGRPYLIKLGGTQPVNFVLTGRPRIRTIAWMADSFNFVGAYLSETAPPTFEAFFAPSPAHAGEPIYRMGSDGRWQKVAQPATETMRRGEAYWVYCRGESKYQGPLSVAFDGGDGLDYSRIVTEQTLRIQNALDTSHTITILPIDSREPPSTSFPALAGNVPLSYFQTNLPDKRYDWLPVSGPLTQTIGPNAELALRLAVRRTDMPPYTPPPGRAVLYQGLLGVSDGAGLLLVLPVTAKGLDAPRVESVGAAPRGFAPPGSSPGKMDNPPPTVHPRAGLWVGNATINAVSNPTSGSLDPNKSLPVAAPFTLRLIVHVDSSGQPRFLQQVLQMWKEGAWIPNPNDPTSSTYILDPNNPGRVVLLTDDSLIPRFSGIALHDVKLVGRRLSTAAFGFRQPILMSGDFGSFGTTITCQVGLSYKDAVNPFMHQYHPDHDNLDERYEQEVPESYTVNRDISLGFTAEDPEDRSPVGWGDELLGGYYLETIQGIHRNPIHVRGIFHFQRLSDVWILNDGLR